MIAKRRTFTGAWFSPALLAGAFLLVDGALLWFVHADEKHRRAEDLADSTQSVRESLLLRLRGNETTCCCWPKRGPGMRWARKNSSRGPAATLRLIRS